MKLAAFDMDGTLLEGRTILILSKKFGFLGETEELLQSNLPLYKVSLALAELMKDIALEDAKEVVRGMHITKGVKETLAEMKRMGYKLAIITDSYDFVATHFVSLLGMDSFISNRLVVEDGVFTGELVMPTTCQREEASGYPSVCKRHALLRLVEDFGASLEATVAVGDNKPDGGMLDEAGLGIAFDPKARELEDVADVVIRERDFTRILDYL